MKTALYIAFAAFLFFGVGCMREPGNIEKQPEKSAPVLRDPFRPDHPTREQVEAERAKREEEQPQK